MRVLIALFAAMSLASPAKAWEFTPGLPCVLTHEEADVAVELTYDPTGPLYSISISRPMPFAPSRVFSMQFVGPSPLTIATDRQSISNNGRTITVTDQGFGNVLNGLQFNRIAIAQLGEDAVEIDLSDAPGPVAAFRACDGAPTA